MGLHLQSLQTKGWPLDNRGTNRFLDLCTFPQMKPIRLNINEYFCRTHVLCDIWNTVQYVSCDYINDTATFKTRAALDHIAVLSGFFLFVVSVLHVFIASHHTN